MGVNVSGEFLHMASEFLNCRIGKVSFTYLGLPVSATPRGLRWLMRLVSGRMECGGGT
jgi:hypothetical protein